MAYRGIYLLGIPLLMNFALFYVHFAILSNSGPGNAFVSIPFQDTLKVEYNYFISIVPEYYLILYSHSLIMFKIISILMTGFSCSCSN